MNFSKVLWACVAFLLLLLPTPTDAQGIRAEAVSEALQRDAAAYAELFGTDIAEAHRRLALQTKIGALDAALTEESAETFAGLWIDHEPEYRVVALFTNAALAQEWISEEALGELASLITVRPAAITLKQLELHLEEAAARLQRADQQADLWINVRENQVEILTPNPAELTAALGAKRVALPQGTAIVEAEALAEPVADVRGGRPVTGCTAGFAVRSPTGRLGLTTAAHCGNTQTYEDNVTALPLISERYREHHDVQWHAASCSDQIFNQVFDGTSNRTITGSVGRGSQSIGMFVCKYGRTTDDHCAVIDGKSYKPGYVPSAKSTFITAFSNVPISLGGDSGGPWFLGNNAYGVNSGKSGSSGTRAIYMAVNFMTSQGYSPLTYPAGVSPYAILSCTNDSSSFSCTASGRNGNPPYTFSNWQYYGPATSWSGGGTGINGSFGSFPGCRTGDYNYVTVRITDACGRTGSGDAVFYCPSASDCGLSNNCLGPSL
ncbi:MAG: hypothetical protein AAGD01_10555 [Acidobacteriota bacterium]